MTDSPPPWYAVGNLEQIASPALLVYRDRVEDNIRRMIARAGGTGRLRPHVKTHKMAEVARLHLLGGITRFKCATIAEAEMLGRVEAPDVLLAYQPVGPNMRRFVELARAFPRTRFSTLVDNAETARELGAAGLRASPPITATVYLDVDCGMHRSGAQLDDGTLGLYQALSGLSGLRVAGVHAYDGHIHTPDPARRQAECNEAFTPLLAWREAVVKAGLPRPVVVAGGTPTFPWHAARNDFECSPGTCVFWDAGYQRHFPDLDFIPAALVLTRVVSRPGRSRLCLDLGHKAIASENPHPRVEFFDLPGAQAVMHSEEHLVIETGHADRFRVGDALFGLPWHICPTVALYSQAAVIENGRAVSSWVITRDRKLTI